MLLVILEEANQFVPDVKERTFLEDCRNVDDKREAKNPVLFNAAMFVFNSSYSTTQVIFQATAKLFDC